MDLPRRSILIAAMSAALAVPVAVGAPPAGQTEYELVMTRDPDLAKGEQLYDACKQCHGAHAEGGMNGSVPALAGQPYTVLARQIVAFRVGLRKDNLMAHFTDRQYLLFSQPIADVAAYIARLTPPVSATRAVPHDAQKGAKAYARSCERCHGTMAEGNYDTQTPRLASQYSGYLMSQLDDAAEGRRIAMTEAHSQISPMPKRDALLAIAHYLESIER